MIAVTAEDSNTFKVCPDGELMGYQRSARTVAITQLHQAAKTPKERHECALDALLQRVLQDLSATTPRQLSLITWSLARLHLRRDLRGLKSTLERRAFELDPQGVSMTMWSLAAALWRQPLFDRLGEAAYWKLGELDAQGLSNVLWSCAVLRKDSLFSLLLIAASRINQV